MITFNLLYIFQLKYKNKYVKFLGFSIKMILSN